VHAGAYRCKTTLTLVLAYITTPEKCLDHTEVVDRPTPATTAEPLADIFLTAQFRLALLIASVAYFWRYHAGARLRHPRFDYMEALGFAAHAAAADLPKVFWQTCHSSERRCSKSSTVSVPVSILARTSRSHYKLTWRDRWFESVFLQRGVTSEPRREHSGAGARAPSGRTYVSAVQAANALARRVLIEGAWTN